MANIAIKSRLGVEAIISGFQAINTIDVCSLGPEAQFNMTCGAWGLWPGERLLQHNRGQKCHDHFKVNITEAQGLRMLSCSYVPMVQANVWALTPNFTGQGTKDPNSKTHDQKRGSEEIWAFEHENWAGWRKPISRCKVEL